jgi:hypothetical protein
MTKRRASTSTKEVTGYIVKRELWEEVPDPKRYGQTIKLKRRVEVGRVYHSLDAAKTLMEMLKKAHPDGDFYIHEKRRSADHNLV